MEYSQNDNVAKLEINGKTIYLVGTAHISQESVDLVENVIKEVSPDCIAVELCEPRYESIKNPKRWQNLDLFTVIKEGRAYVLIAQLILAGFQKKLGSNLDVKPGAEMISGIKAAEATGATLVLADREVKTTLKRTWANLSIFSIFKVIIAMIGGLFSAEKISKDEIERLKSTDALEELLKDFTNTFPDVKETLIDERDKFLAQKIKESPGTTIVAIVGAGHTPGIKKYIHEEINLKKLSNIPKPSFTRKVLPWMLPGIVVGLIIYGFIRADLSTGIDMVYAWVIVNSLLGGLGAALALAHPITILVATIVSPFTSLNPFVAAGWIAGLSEAFIRKPRVKDLETVADDITTIRGIWGNRALKVLLVIITTNLFGSIGTFIGIERIINIANG